MKQKLIGILLVLCCLVTKQARSSYYSYDPKDFIREFRALYRGKMVIMNFDCMLDSLHRKTYYSVIQEDSTRWITPTATKIRAVSQEEGERISNALMDRKCYESE